MKLLILAVLSLNLPCAAFFQHGVLRRGDSCTGCYQHQLPRRQTDPSSSSSAAAAWTQHRPPLVLVAKKSDGDADSGEFLRGRGRPTARSAFITHCPPPLSICSAEKGQGTAKSDAAGGRRGVVSSSSGIGGGQRSEKAQIESVQESVDRRRPRRRHCHCRCGGGRAEACDAARGVDY